MNWPLLQNSLAVALLTTVAALAAGGMLAVAAAGVGGRWRRVLIGAAVAVFALPPFLVTNTWLHYFGLTGAWRPYLDFNIYSLEGTVFVLSLQLWPIAFGFVLARLMQIERAYLEQEPLLRGGSFFRHLAWPAARGAVWQSGLLIFVLALNNFAVPALLQVKVYPAEVWLSFNTRFDYVEALRLSWPLIAGPLLLVLYFRARPVRFSWRSREFSAELFRERTGSAAFWAAAAAGAALLVISLAVPGWQLLSSARMWSELVPAISAVWKAFGNSFLFAGCAAGIVLGLGLLLRGWRWPVASWVLLFVPGVLLGISLIWIFNRSWLGFVYQSTAIVLIAYALRFVALGWGAARGSLQQADGALLDVARSFGARRWEQFRLVEWPRGGGYLLGAAGLVYLLCLWDVETLIFIVPPGRETLALRIFNMLHYGHATQVDALCVWLLVLALAPLGVWGIWKACRGRLAALALVMMSLCWSGCTGSTEQDGLGSDLFASVEIIGTRGTGPGQFNKPRSLALDAEDNLYVVDLTGRVQKFSREGKIELSWQMPETDIGKPKGMIGDDEGGVIVIEPHYSRVNHFTPGGELLRQWGRHGTNGGQLSFPRSAALNSWGEIYLSEYGMVERVQRFGRGGAEFLGTFGEAGTAPGQFNRPEAVGVGPDDKVYVADSCNHRVPVFSREGEFLTSFGRAGSGRGEMSYPYDVRIDQEGTIFVCEFGNSRIQIFDPAHQPIGMLGGSGLERGQLNNPWSMALDSGGNLFVADSGNHRVQKFVRKEPLARSKSMEVSLAK